MHFEEDCVQSITTLSECKIQNVLPISLMDIFTRQIYRASVLIFSEVHHNSTGIVGTLKN